MTQETGDARDFQQVRWNLGALMLDVTFFSLGMAFIDANAVLPLLMERLGAGGPLIGAFAALRFLAFTGLQIFVAHRTHGQIRQKPWLAFVAIVTRLPLLILPWFLWQAAVSPLARQTALWATILILGLWALGDGLGYVPWMEIVARAFSNKTRGRFFASTQLASGLCSVAVAGLFVQRVLHTSAFPYPHNYALLAAVAAVMFQISLLGVLLIREPPPPIQQTSPPPIPPLADYFRRLPMLLRNEPTFARLAAVQSLIGFGAASAPFYVLYATRRFHLGDEWGGRYQVAQAISVVVLMPVWAYLSERRNPASAVRGVALACLLTPLLALTIGRASPWLFGLVFLMMGGSLGWGMWIALNHFLLTHISEGERSIYIALLNFLFIPSALYPFLGGFLVQKEGFLEIFHLPLLFVLTSFVTASGFLISLRLRPEDSPGG